MNARLCVSSSLHFLLLLLAPLAFAESTVVAEDDASESAYSSMQWDNSKNGGRGFTNWTLTVESKGDKSYAGFYIGDSSISSASESIAKNKRAFGAFANGAGFEQAVGYRGFEKPLKAGDSFSFMIENGTFEKKGDEDDPTPGSIGLTLRTGNANSSVADYNKDVVFEFGYYQGKSNYQIYDGTENSDSGVALADGGVSVTVTITGSDSYDLEIQTMKDKKLTKLAGRKLKNSSPIQTFAIFDRNGEKNDAFFNQFQVAHESK
jgi:hypothetical protein